MVSETRFILVPSLNSLATKDTSRAHVCRHSSSLWGEGIEGALKTQEPTVWAPGPTP